MPLRTPSHHRTRPPVSRQYHTCADRPGQHSRIYKALRLALLGGVLLSSTITLPLQAGQSAAAEQPSAASATPQASTPDAAPALPAGVMQVGQPINGITEYRLRNGLTVLLGPDESKPTMTINLVYRVGSRHEGPGEAGMAHLLEHMMFKGTEQIPDPKKELTRRGIDWNGTTWYDRTNYFGQFNASDSTRDWMLSWLADTMQHIHIDAGKLKSERPIVINEMESNENRASTVLYHQLMATAYGFHPYSRSVIGVLSDLDAVAPSRLQTFYERYYRPDNAVLIITGQFEEAATLAAVQRQFGGIAQPDTPIPQPYTLDPTQQGERDIVVRRTGGVPLLLAGYHTPAGATRDSVALSMLGDMLAREPDGPLYRQLVKTGLTVDVGASMSDLYDPGMLIFSATLRNEEQRQSVWDTMRKVVEGELPLSQEALERTRQDIKNGIQRLSDDPESLAMALTEAVAEGDWRLPFAHADWAQTITLDDIRAAGHRWLVRDNRTLAWYLPTQKPVRAPNPSRPDIAALLKDHHWQKGETFKADIALTPASITERTQVGQLASGLRYAILPRKVKGDRVNVALNLQWGNLQNLSGRWREADLIDEMMLAGTKHMSRQVLQDKLRMLDAQLAVNANEAGVQMSLSVPASHLKDALTLAVGALREPVFPQDIFQERRDSVLSSIKARSHQPEAMAEEALAARGHAYPKEDPRHHRTPDEIAADLKVQTAQRLATFWHDFAGASHGQFTLVGHVDPETIKADLQTLLGDWKSPQPYERIRRDYYDLPDDSVMLRVPDKANAVLLQSRRIPLSEDHPDYPALAMAIHLLGGSADARLFQRLREQESISYGAYSELEAGRDVNNATIDIQAILAPANIGRLQKALQEEVDAIHAKGFTQNELDAARSALLDQRRQYLASEANVTMLLASNLFWQTDMSRWTRREAQLRALTLAQVNAAFRKWFDPKKALTISAGSFPAEGSPANARPSSEPHQHRAQ